MTTVKGTLNVDEAVTLDTTLDVTGDTSVTTFDSTGATSLATGSGAVNIASSGQMTTVKGTLNVDEAVTLDTTLDVTDATTLSNTLSVSSHITTNSGNVVISSGQLHGPSVFVIDPATIGNNSGKVSIKGNLEVLGTQTTVNSTTVELNDNRMKLNASSSADAGLEVGFNDGSTALFTYVNSSDTWNTHNKNLNCGPSGKITYGTLNDGSTDLAASIAELNILDGHTSATSITVADADRVVLNDNGTMKQVAVTDLADYFDDKITAMSNLITTAATTVGALSSGSITTGFGSINNGTSSITTGGRITYGTLNDGSTDLAASIAELNILDGHTSATSITVADADRVVLNDNGTMKQVAVTDLADYFDDKITAMSNLITTAATTVGALSSGSITTGFGSINNGSSSITTNKLKFTPENGATLSSNTISITMSSTNMLLCKNLTTTNNITGFIVNSSNWPNGGQAVISVNNSSSSAIQVTSTQSYSNYCIGWTEDIEIPAYGYAVFSMIYIVNKIFITCNTYT